MLLRIACRASSIQQLRGRWLASEDRVHEKESIAEEQMAPSCVRQIVPKWLKPPRRMRTASQLFAPGESTFDNLRLAMSNGPKTLELENNHFKRLAEAALNIEL